MLGTKDRFMPALLSQPQLLSHLIPVIDPPLLHSTPHRILFRAIHVFALNFVRLGHTLDLSHLVISEIDANEPIDTDRVGPLCNYTITIKPPNLLDYAFDVVTVDTLDLQWIGIF